jgi:1-acyl-sn-glycerol-3-phosphate acyltransferase
MCGVGAMPLRQDGPVTAMMRHARERLLGGRMVVIFPEGTPSHSEQVAPFHGAWGCWP